MRTTILVPEAVVAVAALFALVGPAVSARFVPTRRSGTVRWALPGVVALALLVALVYELAAGAAVGDLFGGGFRQDRLALYVKATVLLALLVAVLAADWDVEAAPGALPILLLAGLGVMVEASATDVAGLLAGTFLAVGSAVAAVAARPGAARPLGAPALAATLLMAGALACAFLVAVAGGTGLAGIRSAFAGAGAALPYSITGLLAVGSFGALAVAAPLAFGETGGTRTPLAAGVAGGVGAFGAAVAAVRLAAVLTGVAAAWTPGLAVLAGGVVVVASLAAAAGGPPRRVIALLAAAQAGWVMAALAFPDRDATGAALLAAGVLAVAGTAGLITAGELELQAAVGMSGRQPARAFALALAALTLAGVPPLAGFFGLGGIAVGLAGGGRWWLLLPLLAAWAPAWIGAVRLLHAVFVARVEDLPRGAAVAARVAPTGAARMAGAGAVFAVLVLLALVLFANPVSSLAVEGAAALGLP